LSKEGFALEFDLAGTRLGRRWWNLFSAFALALTLFLPLARGADAGSIESDRWIDAMLDLYADYCSANGGVIDVHIDYALDGTVNGLWMWCTGAILANDFGCVFWWDEDWECWGGFVAPEEWSENTAFGEIENAQAGENPISTPTVDLDRTEERPRVTGRPTETPAPEQDSRR
jgi:hypothetical protein